MDNFTNQFSNLGGRERGSELVPVAQNAVQTLNRFSENLTDAVNNLTDTITTLLPFSGAFGTFTCANNTNTTVTDTSVAVNSIILLMPTNAAAGTLMGAATSLYVSARTADTSFVVTTANAAAAAGTETFSYVIINP